MTEQWRVEPVGSLLRPDYLREARRRRVEGELSPLAFKRIEDRAVREAVALQEEVGLPVVTDGEMRRLSFQSQMVEAVEGFRSPGLSAFLWGDWKADDEVGDRRIERPETIGIDGELTPRRHLAAEEYTTLRNQTDRVGKVTLPSPGLFLNFWDRDGENGPYETVDQFVADVVEILQWEVDELVRLGATYIQLDAPHYPLLLDEETRAFYESRTGDWRHALDSWIDWDNAVLEHVPDEVTRSIHTCRGNQKSRWLVEGEYDPIAERLFGRIEADRLLLEYDDARSGGFEPLEFVPAGRTVVLGLVSTKTDELETTDALLRRIDAAAERIDRERLAISPQCGFASSVVGNRLSRDSQRAKLARLVETADRAFPA